MQSGQKGQNLISQKNWPLFFEKRWKFQPSSMKNGKVSILDVAQWSKKVKIPFEKSLITDILQKNENCPDNFYPLCIQFRCNFKPFYLSRLLADLAEIWTECSLH